MSRTATVIVFLISLLLVGGGGFLLGNALLLPPQNTSNVAQSILDKAKHRVPEPALPPKPAGREETVMVPIKRTIQVPRVEMKGIVPRVVMDTHVIEENVPQVRIVDAAPEEIASWDAQVKVIREEYNRRLDAEINKLSRKRG